MKSALYILSLSFLVIGTLTIRTNFSQTNQWHLYTSSNSDISIGSVKSVDFDINGDTWFSITEVLAKYNGIIYTTENSGLFKIT